MEKIKPKVLAHGSYIGKGGYNNHTRDFFRHLSKLIDVKVRNFTIGDDWAGNVDEPHNSEDYLNDTDKKILALQSLWEDQSKGLRHDHPIYSKYKNEFVHNVNIVLQETNHNYYWDDYTGPKIGYNVWESTEQPKKFFEKLLEYDQIWVPSQWQADCTIKQGANPSKVKVVPEGVDISTYNLEETKNIPDEYNDGRFKFIHFGRWDYRKSTKEIIETFLKTFDESDPVDLILSVDNRYGFYADACNTTEERIKKYNIPADPRLKFISFVSREDYISYLKKGNVFLSCARSEGWNLPLIEAMSCGTPSIYSNCSAQLEFAEGKGLPVKILGEKPCQGNMYDGYTHSLQDGVLPGNFYEPDFNDLSKVMRDAYKNYDKHKEQAIIDANIIHAKYNWDAVAEVGRDTLQDLLDNFEEKDDNEIHIEYKPSPKVEIIGKTNKLYRVEFWDIETNTILHSDTIKNNMWCSINESYIKDSLNIKINGEFIDSVKKRLDNKIFLSKSHIQKKNHLVDLHSSSLGDTIAIMPYLNMYAIKNDVQIYLKGPKHFSDLFKVTYPSVIFTDRDKKEFHHIIDIIHDFSKPLQQYMAEQLGFKDDYYYVRPRIDSFKKERPVKNKYITFGIHSTLQMKYWNHPDGEEVQGESLYWNKLSKMLRKSNLTPVCLELNESFGVPPHYNVLPKSSVNKTGMDLKEVINYIEHSEFYIGLSSGMAWVAHALGKPVAMIANFTEDWNEFDLNEEDYIRITNKDVCHGCWHTEHINIGDWNNCPKHQNTDKQFECHTSITPELVFDKIKKWI